MRVGLRDILGLADFEQNLVELSALAEACLSYALEVVLRQHGLKSQPLVIIGLGKLGGAELNYGSDLDITFVADAKFKNLQELQRTAAEVMDMLSSPTEMGTVFPTDARLRPDGEKGLLVNTHAAYEEYYRHRAQLWEVQALCRARAVAGNLELGERFQKMARSFTDFSRPPQSLAAYTPDWKSEIHRMRQRIERERTPAGQQPLAIKTGTGGLMDAEFAAQTLCLSHGWHEPNTLNALLRARDESAIPQREASLLIENYRSLRRVEGILRRWSYAGEVLLPNDPAPQYRVAVRCGFTSANHLMDAIARCRAAIRTAYSKIMETAE
jgi:glutamate-ammonia-ligase adenylyltransferase